MRWPSRTRIVPGCCGWKRSTCCTDSLVWGPSCGSWAATVAAEALPRIAHGRFRALIARELEKAGRGTHRSELVLEGRREVFFSLPSEAHLLQLVQEAERQGRRDAEVEGALEFVSGSAELVASKEEGGKTLLFELLLMTGRLEAAFERAGGIRALGWSMGERAGALLFAAILSFLSLQRIEEAVTVRRLLERYADSGDKPWDVIPEEKDGGQKSEEGEEVGGGAGISEEILRGLRSAAAGGEHNPAVTERNRSYLGWAVRLARRRIDAIVSNKHRGAYDRAAQVLGALAECCIVTGNRRKGRDLVVEFRNRKYNRHSAFRREVDRVVASSALLSGVLREQ